MTILKHPKNRENSSYVQSRGTRAVELPRHHCSRTIPWIRGVGLDVESCQPQLVDEISTSSPDGRHQSDDEVTPVGEPDGVTEALRQREIDFSMLMRAKGYEIRPMAPDGACLFRAVADQVYGDEDFHDEVRKRVIDYMAQNSDHFKEFVAEDFSDYLRRKEGPNTHGNHVEIQAICEIFNRPVEVYQYTAEPINIFSGSYSAEYEPIRLTYHMNCHYNSLVDPTRSNIGVGLGLPNLTPRAVDQELVAKVKENSETESTQIEQAMLNDKLRETDWENTDNVLANQMLQQSYVEWLKTQPPLSSIAATTKSNIRTDGQSSSSGESAKRQRVNTNASDWVSEQDEEAIIAQLLAQSQQEYIASILVAGSSSTNEKGDSS